MDEIMGRRYAKQLGFNLTDTIGVKTGSKAESPILITK
jgi:predicted nucleic acid-binding protein